MTDQAYDDTNKGSLWLTHPDGSAIQAVAGQANVGGADYWAYLFATGIDEGNKPKYKAFLSPKDHKAGLDPVEITLFPPREGAPEFARGGGTAIVQGETYFVDLNAVDAVEGKRSPAVRLKFKAKDQQGSTPAPQAEEVPF